MKADIYETAKLQCCPQPQNVNWGEEDTYSLCTRWLRRSWVTCSCQPFRTPVLEGGAAAGIVLRLPMLPEFEPSFISGLRREQGHASSYSRDSLIGFPSQQNITLKFKVRRSKEYINKTQFILNQFCSTFIILKGEKNAIHPFTPHYPIKQSPLPHAEKGHRVVSELCSLSCPSCPSDKSRPKPGSYLVAPSEVGRADSESKFGGCWSVVIPPAGMFIGLFPLKTKRKEIN